MPKQPAKKNGRPKAPSITPPQVYALSELQCTLAEAAAGLNMAVSTLQRKMTNDPALREAWDRGREFGKLSLRRQQWKLAQGDGSSAVQMTIHLSKHWLGETEKSTQEIVGANGGPIQLAALSRIEILQRISGELDSLAARQRALEIARADSPDQGRIAGTTMDVEGLASPAESAGA